MSEQKVHGRTFVLTPEKLAIIRTMSGMCARERAMAKAIGVGPTFFSELKKRHPEIVEAIEEGRAQAEIDLLEISWSIIRSGSSRERSRELDRMYTVLGLSNADLDGNNITQQPLEFKFVQVQPPEDSDGD